MAIEIKEIIVKTTVSEASKQHQFDQITYNKLKKEILNELKREQDKNKRLKRDR